jgi:putative transposase
MSKKRFRLLRQIEGLMSQGMAAPIACRETGVSQQSYYRRRKEYGGLEVDQAKRMKELEPENVRLKRLVAILSLEKQVLKTLPRETCKARAAPAGSAGYSGEVQPLGTSRLPDRGPATGDTTVHQQRSG